MTQDEWRRRRDAQRLVNYHNARLAEDAARQEQAVRMPDHEMTPPLRSMVDGEIIAFDEASDLTPEALAEFAKVVQRNMEERNGRDLSAMLMGGMVRLGVDMAGEPREGRQTTGREILARQLRPGGIRFIPRHEYEKAEPPPMQGPPDPQVREAKYYKDRFDCNRSNAFDRWFDIEDSEEELEQFLFKCFKYGKNFRNDGSMDMSALEEN